MKIFHITRRFCPNNWGGIEEAVLNLAKQQKLAGHDVEILCTKALNKEALGLIDGVTVRRFSYLYPYLLLSRSAKDQMDKKGGSPISYSMMRFISSNRPDVIHCHSQGRLNDYLSTLASQMGLPFFLTLHGGLNCVSTSEDQLIYKPKLINLPFGRILDLYFSKSPIKETKIICVSLEEKEALAHKDSFYIPNGVSDEFDESELIDFRSQLGIKSKKIILNVSRIDRQKNQLYLVKSMKKLKEQNYHLILCGPITDESYYKDIKVFIKKNGLQSYITFFNDVKPRSKELSSLYRCSDVFALASVHEPFGIVLLEAWQYGLPVLAHSVGGVKDLLDVFSGKSFNIESTDSFCKAVQNLDYRTAQAILNQKIIKKSYSWASIAKSHLSLYSNNIQKEFV